MPLTREMPMHCPQCGNDCDRLDEGYCPDCTRENYAQLFAHNFEYRRWQQMSDSERSDEIRRAIA